MFISTCGRCLNETHEGATNPLHCEHDNICKEGEQARLNTKGGRNHKERQFKV